MNFHGGPSMPPWQSAWSPAGYSRGASTHEQAREQINSAAADDPQGRWLQRVRDPAPQSRSATLWPTTENKPDFGGEARVVGWKITEEDRAAFERISTSEGNGMSDTPTVDAFKAALSE